jgi:cytochrome c
MYPALVGTVGEDVLLLNASDGAARDVQFATALDIFEWVSENMPGDDPGGLEASEYVDILAFALSANGVELDEPLSGDNAADIMINRTFDNQVADGMELYGDNCAHCHGDGGEGTDLAPAVVGTVGDDVLLLDPADDAVRDVQFATALDVFGWVSENMPGDDAGSLETDEYVDILAFALFANGVELDEPLSGDNAGDIVINE